MILYVRYDAPPELRLRYHFRNRFGKDILGARDYDPVSGVGHKLNPNGTGDLVEFFEPNGFVEVDGHTNPSQEVLDALFKNTQIVISNREALDQIARRVSADVRLEEGKKANNPQSQE
jgi:hypothetical protein